MPTPRRLLLAGALAACASAPRADDVTFEISQVLVDTELASADETLTADVDGDGDLDLSLAGELWLENTDGLGTFGPPRAITSLAVEDHVFADLDGDGDLDALVIGWDDDVEVCVWIPNVDGAGTFGAPVLITDDDLNHFEVDAFDVDGDGDLDVVRNANTIGCVWYPNVDGAGTFGAPLTIDPDTNFRFDLADLDGDGDLDAVTALANQSFAVALNTGGGAFATPVVFTVTSSSSASALDPDLVDLDGDGDADLLGGDTWYANDGSGTFGSGTTFASQFLLSSAADVDDDGDLDIAGVELGSSGAAVWYENNGGASFASVQTISGSGDEDHLTLGDTDGDGDLDALVTASTQLFPFRNDAGTFTPLFSLTTSVEGPPQIVDLDGDGDADVLADLRGNPELGWFEQLADGSFAPRQAIDIVVDDDAVAGDLDGDGDMDLIAPSGPLRWFENLGGLVFGPPINVTPGTDLADSHVIADIDGDGDNDIFAVDSGPFWRENVAGDASTWTVHPVLGATSTVQTLADLDGDGDLDLLGAGFSAIEVQFFDAGSFGPPVTLDPSFGFTAPLAVDVDDDGDRDVLYQYIESGVGVFVAAVENTDGAGTFGAPMPLAGAEPSGTPLAGGDVDGDGDTDVVGAGAWLENTDGAFALVARAEHPVAAWTAGDLDADGVPEALGPFGALHVMTATSLPNAFTALGDALAGTLGEPSLVGTGCLVGDTAVTLALSGALPGSTTSLVVGIAELAAPFKGGVLVPTPTILVSGLPLDGAGALTLVATWPSGFPPGFATYYQHWIVDAGAPKGLAASNALVGVTP